MPHFRHTITLKKEIITFLNIHLFICLATLLFRLFLSGAKLLIIFDYFMDFATSPLFQFLFFDYSSVSPYHYAKITDFDFTYILNLIAFSNLNSYNYLCKGASKLLVKLTDVVCYAIVMFKDVPCVCRK
jgi:hypothetical protein